MFFLEFVMLLFFENNNLLKKIGLIAILIYPIIFFVYQVFKSDFIKGQSIPQKMFRLKFNTKSKWQLRIKNIIDSFTFPISFITILFFNKSISERIMKIDCVDIDNRKEKDSYYIFEKFLIYFYCICFVLFLFIFSSRITMNKEKITDVLNNSKIITEKIGSVEKISYRDLKPFGNQTGKGEIIFKLKATNENGEKFIVDIYYNSEINWYSKFIIENKEYVAEPEHFDLNETLNKYQEIYNNFQEKYKDEFQATEISGREDVIEKADKLWESFFTEEPLAGLKYKVYYDKNNDCYMVYAYPADYNTVGGGRRLLIKADGEVIAIWGEK